MGLCVEKLKKPRPARSKGEGKTNLLKNAALPGRLLALILF